MSLLAPLETGGSWLLVTFHDALIQPGLPDAHGLAWWLAIALLVITVRVILLPLAIRQRQAQQKLARLRPQLDDLKRRHKHSRDDHQKALATLFREHGVSPFASMAPMLLQIPLVLALYRVLNGLSHDHVIGAFTSHPAAAASASAATLLGVHLSSTLGAPGHGGPMWASRLVIIAVVLLTAAITYVMQRHAMLAESEPRPVSQSAVANLSTASVLLFGCFVPFGVLVYWLTNTAFLASQQRLIPRLSGSRALDR